MSTRRLHVPEPSSGRRLQPAAAEASAAPRRLSLSQVLELVLSRGGHDRSSVSLTRNAKGDTQIEVVVRTGDSGDVMTATDAAAKARAIYDDLRAAYPPSSASPGAPSA